MFENRALRSLFGPKVDAVTERWRKFHNMELHNCTFHQIFLRWSFQEEWDGCGMYHAWGKTRNVCKIKCEVKRPMEELDLSGSGWIQWQALVNTVMNLWVQLKVGNFLTSWVAVSFSRTLFRGVSYLVRMLKLVTLLHRCDSMYYRGFVRSVTKIQILEPK
jgi:hypothetical protein